MQIQPAEQEVRQEKVHDQLICQQNNGLNSV